MCSTDMHYSVILSTFESFVNGNFDKQLPQALLLAIFGIFIYITNSTNLVILTLLYLYATSAPRQCGCCSCVGKTYGLPDGRSRPRRWRPIGSPHGKLSTNLISFINRRDRRFRHFRYRSLSFGSGTNLIGFINRRHRRFRHFRYRSLSFGSGTNLIGFINRRHRRFRHFRYRSLPFGSGTSCGFSPDSFLPYDSIKSNKASVTFRSPFPATFSRNSEGSRTYPGFDNFNINTLPKTPEKTTRQAIINSANSQNNQIYQSNNPVVNSINTPTMPPTETAAGATPTQPTTPVLPPGYRMYAAMARPNSPEALSFDGIDVSDFIYRWNNECDDCGLSNSQKCSRLPDYCTPDIKKAVKLLDGHKSGNWEILQQELKDLFWQDDQETDTIATLNQLVRDASRLHLNVFILQYTSISDALVKRGALSNLDRVNRLLDGLSEDLRGKVLDFCAKKEWRLSSRGSGTREPEFETIKTYILTKAKAIQNQTFYNSERAARDGIEASPPSTRTSSVMSTPSTSTAPTAPSAVSIPIPSIGHSVNTPNPTPLAASDPIAELTKQFSNLALLIQGAMQPSQFTPGSRPFSGNKTFIPRCTWCDCTNSNDHTYRRDCSSFMEHLRDGKVRVNEKHRVINASTGEEFPLNYGRGGIKALYEASSRTTTSPISNVTAITVEPIARLGNSPTIHLTKIDFEKGTKSEEIIEVDVYEKRKRDEILKRRMRPRLDDDVQPPSLVPLDSTTEPPRSQTVQPPENPDKPSKKFRLASEINETVSVAQVGERVMDTIIPLPLRDIVAVAPGIAGYMHEQTRRKRVPINASTANAEGEYHATQSDGDATTPKSEAYSRSVSTEFATPLYACASAKAPVTIDKRLEAEALLDDGSEVNLIAKRAFDELGLPIDTEVAWKITGYNEQTEAKLSDGGVIGVCHDVSVNIGGVGIPVHLFVVEHCNSDVILGRPWYRAARANVSNEDDGSCKFTIRSLDDRRMVEFTAVRPNHERNRQFAREPLDDTVGRKVQALKV